MDTYILNTVDLSKTYKSNELVVNAVSKVSLQVKPGEFIALVGPSGSGKTTMLAMLATLLESTEGHIYIDGEPFDNIAAPAHLLPRLCVGLLAAQLERQRHCERCTR